MAAAASSLRVIEGSMDKDKALAAALSQIERNFGKGTVMKFDQGAITQVYIIIVPSLNRRANTKFYTRINGFQGFRHQVC